MLTEYLAGTLCILNLLLLLCILNGDTPGILGNTGRLIGKNQEVTLSFMDIVLTYAVYNINLALLVSFALMGKGIYNSC